MDSPANAAAMADTPKKPEQLQSLQAFRGLAALAVVFYHAGLFSQRRLGQDFCGNFFQHGDMGVDFFFVLSGFIITLVHWDDVGRPERAPRYLWRRFFRIYPLLFLLTTFKLAAGLVMPMDKEGLDATRVISAYLLLPMMDGSMPVITAAWTLCHEALFYGVFLGVILLGRGVGRWLLTGWALALLLVHGAGLKLVGLPAFLLDAHNVQFLLGVAVCLALRRGSLSAGLIWAVVLVAGALVWAALPLMVEQNGKDQSMAVRLLLGVAFAGVIAVAVSAERRGLWKKTPAWAVWLGEASYSIYLGHSIVMLGAVSFLARWGRAGLAQAHGVSFAAMGGALLFCAMLWCFAERPLLRWSKGWCR